MPSGGVENRSEQLALVAGLLHERGTDPRLGELLAALEGSDPARGSGGARRGQRARRPAGVRPVRSAAAHAGRGRRSHDRARAESLGRRQRAASDFARFRPWLERIVALKRAEAECVGYDRRAVRRAARGLRAGTQQRRRGPAVRRAAGASWCRWPHESPRRHGGRTPRCSAGISRATASAGSVSGSPAAVGFDFARGRMDLGVHPSCTGIGAGDCRIAVRFDERDFAGGLFTILHEVGHGLYEQGLDPGALRHAARRDCLGRHGRGAGPILGEPRRPGPAASGTTSIPQARELFPESLGDVPIDEFHFALNRVTPSLIRVNADEVTYNLHVMVRFELERALVSGTLAVAGPARGVERGVPREPRSHAADRRGGLSAGRSLGRRDDRLLPHLHAGRRVRGPALRRRPSASWAASASSSRGASSRCWCAGLASRSTGRAAAIRRPS